MPPEGAANDFRLDFLCFRPARCFFLDGWLLDPGTLEDVDGPAGGREGSSVENWLLVMTDKHARGGN